MLNGTVVVALRAESREVHGAAIPWVGANCGAIPLVVANSSRYRPDLPRRMKTPTSVLTCEASSPTETDGELYRLSVTHLEEPTTMALPP